MELLVLFIGIAPLLASGLSNSSEELANSTDSNKDMYVIHAMVYQVGIMTNKTDDDATNFTTGKQEAITFFHNNGSQVDLSSLPAPLMTNVTAQSMVGVAPASPDQGQPMPWTALEKLASLQHSAADGKSDDNQPKTKRRTDDKDYQDTDETVEHSTLDDHIIALFKRQVNSTPVEIVKGSANIPLKAGVQSLAIPPLLSFNNNMSDIPIPIPNTSVVHYAKINTLVTMP